MKRAKENVQFIIGLITNASTNFKEKVKCNYIANQIMLEFPQGFDVVSCQLNKLEKQIFEQKLKSFKKHIELMPCSTALN